MGQALAVELLEFLAAPRERPAGALRYALPQCFDRAVQPYRDAARLQALAVLALGKCPAPQSQHSRAAPLREAQLLHQSGMLELPEFPFPFTLEDFDDRRAGLALDFLVQIHELPAQPLGKQPAHRGLAAAHEADQNNDRGVL